MEYVDTVDEENNIIGRELESRKNDLGFISRNIIVFIQDPEGNYVICKRAPHKKVDPNLYDASVCGNVKAGESYEEAAKRELLEELGIICELKQMAVIYNEIPHNNLSRKYFTGVFYGRSNDTIVLNDELSEYKKVSHDALAKSMAETPELFCFGFRNEFSQLEEELRAIQRSHQ